MGKASLKGGDVCITGLPGGSNVKNPPGMQQTRFSPWNGKILENGIHYPVFCLQIMDKDPGGSYFSVMGERVRT